LEGRRPDLNGTRSRAGAVSDRLIRDSLVKPYASDAEASRLQRERLVRRGKAISVVLRIEFEEIQTCLTYRDLPAYGG
jgi:hypothetical protein